MASDNERARASQAGFTLAALLVILTIMSIIVAYTVPQQWSLVMKRERERQTIFLMKQYARGIRNFQQKNKALPTSLQQLQDAKEPRLIRGGGKWPCPLTGKEDDWILVPPTAVANGAGGPNGTGGQNPPVVGPAPRGTNPAGTAIRSPSQLNAEASPADYIGPFVGVRPKATGKSYIALNGAESYNEWVYTVQDLENEINMQQMALQRK